MPKNKATELKPSMINHPPHYNAGNIEVIDAIEDWQLDFHEGNVVKYVARSDFKGHKLEDLKKAAWYLRRRIKQLEDKIANATDGSIVIPTEELPKNGPWKVSRS